MYLKRKFRVRSRKSGRPETPNLNNWSHHRRPGNPFSVYKIFLRIVSKMIYLKFQRTKKFTRLNSFWVLYVIVKKLINWLFGWALYSLNYSVKPVTVLLTVLVTYRETTLRENFTILAKHFLYFCIFVSKGKFCDFGGKIFSPWVTWTVVKWITMWHSLCHYVSLVEFKSSN